MIKIAAVDDNVFLLNAVREKLFFFEDLQLVFTAHDGKDFLRKLKENDPIDLVLMDIEMPKMNGIETTTAAKKIQPSLKVLVLTVFDDYDNIFNAMRAGANGYFLKEVEPDDLHRGILQTMEGGAAMTPVIAQKTIDLLRNPRIQEQAISNLKDVQLTKREIEVLEYMSKGLSYTQIAEQLSRSPKTVRNHMANIYKKLEVHSKIEAVQKARNHRFIE